jgi:cell division protein FtsW
MRPHGGMRYSGDKVFTLLFLGVLIFGLLMLASASWPMSFDDFQGNGYYLFVHQLLFGVLPGVVGFLIAYFVPYQVYKRFALPMLGLSIFLLIIVFIPGLGVEIKGSHSWISLGAFSMQPSELVKFTFLMYVAAWLEGSMGKNVRDTMKGLVPFLIVLGIVMLLLLLQPDTGTMGIIVIMALAVYFVAGAPLKYFAFFGVAGALLLSLLFTFSPYRAERLTAFLHPELDKQGAGYQINQALLAVGSGGIFGRGYGHSLQKFQYLPEVAGDSIFAVIAEELGFVLTSVFVLLYVGMLFRGLVIAEHSPDTFGTYLVVGIMAWLGIQAFVNIGAMVGLLPITGVPLPFVSYGGTALAIAMTAVGVVLNVSRTQKEMSV